ncbi:DUF421 domain-containing protein [Emticicia fluvialis]|uniref:DUF421 domain-containing protein n=1 Tax=Emticicia fluvialis TaxID=2974474 RepID=UPI002164FBAC|nr:YetF domain-containing protein [Emticicia fluvialis]
MTSYLDIGLRALTVYLFMILAIRLFGKRELAQLSVIDLVFILLISNAVQNAMVGPDNSLAGGLVAAGVLFVTNFALKKLIGRYQKVGKLIQGEPIMLIYDGKIKEKNLAKAGFTMAELEAAIREHGIEEIEQVDLAVLEVDGNVSVLTDDFKTRSRRKRIHKTLQNPNATT